MLKYSLTNPISEPDFLVISTILAVSNRPTATCSVSDFSFLNFRYKYSISSSAVPMHLLSPHCTLLTPYLTQCTPYTNFLLSTTPFPPISSNIRNNVTIILFRRYLTILCPLSPFPPNIFMSLLLGSALRWIHSYVRAGHSGAYRTPAYWELEPHTRSPRPGPQTLLTCSYAPVSILTWLRFKGLKGSQVLIDPRVSRFQGPKGLPKNFMGRV